MKQLKDMFTLEGKVAIITGAAGNIGIVHAETLAELGCKLILVDIIEEKVKEIAEELWTDEVKASWATFQAEQEAERNPAE